MMHYCVGINFHPLSKYNLKYKEQEFVPHEQIIMFLTAAIYYDFNLAAVMQFVGNNYTTSYRNVPEIMQTLHGVVDESVCKDIHRILTTGCPNHAYGHSTRENFLKYIIYGNHKLVLKNPDLIRKAINKEDRLNYAMPFPCWIIHFIPNLHVTPSGIVIKPGKNDRLTYNSSIKLDWDSQPIKNITNLLLEPDLIYGSAYERHLIQVWNLRISYPTNDILLWDDDVTGAFRHGKFNPEIIGAFAFMLLQLLIIPCGLQFGCTFSPANFKPLARSRQQLAESLSDDVSLLDTHKEYLDTVKFAPEADASVTYVKEPPVLSIRGYLTPTALVRSLNTICLWMIT